MKLPASFRSVILSYDGKKTNINIVSIIDRVLQTFLYPFFHKRMTFQPNQSLRKNTLTTTTTTTTI